MSDGRLSLLSKNLRMQVNQAAGNRKADCDHLMVAQSCTVQVVVERSELVVMGDEPQLGARVSRRHVRSDVSENVFVTQEHCAVDFRFALPGLLVAAEEDLDGHVLTMPNCPPYLTVAATTCGIET